jgi:UDP-N-acetyl-D-mannosaminuronate dehydrogenase
VRSGISDYFSRGGPKAVKKNNSLVVVVGLGEVGQPLCQLISEHREVVGVDIAPVEPIDDVEVMHVCYPFQIQDFVGETARYIELFKPAVTVINSTVAVGTTRTIADRTGAAVVHSPVRGKHARMLQELHSYTKFVGALSPETGWRAASHFEAVGLKTRVLSSPEATELAKLTETTYFGLMIAWAQELERYCDQSGLHYEEIISFYDEIKFFPPVRYFPGIIGGHCVLPNLAILSKFNKSVLLEAIQTSNQMKIERESHSKGTEIALFPTVPQKVAV